MKTLFLGLLTLITSLTTQKFSRFDFGGSDGFSFKGDRLSLEFGRISRPSKEVVISPEDPFAGAGEWTDYDSIPANAHGGERPRYYFEHLGSRIGQNQDTCGVVAIQMLLGYYDSFANDDIVPEEYDMVAREYIDVEGFPCPEDFSQSPGTDDKNKGISRYHNYICDIYEEVAGYNPIGRGSGSAERESVIMKLMEKSGFDASEFSYIQTTDCDEDKLANRTIDYIKQAIDWGLPCIAGGSGHDAVAFAYTDDYVYCCNGWGWVSKTPWSTFRTDATHGASMFAFRVLPCHKHSNNYVDLKTGTTICPDCSHRTQTSIIHGADANFGSVYSNNWVNNHNFVSDHLNINSKYLRTTSSDDGSIIMCGKKAGGTEAYVEFLSDKTMEQIDFDYSFLYKSDLAYKNMIEGEFWALIKTWDNNYYWVERRDLLISNLSNRDDKTTHFTFVSQYNPERDDSSPVIGFRIIIHGPSVGSRDEGLITFENITVRSEYKYY